MKFTLGTVQFGLDYGIANKQGKPDQSKAHEILDTALEFEVDYLDTAMAYGNSQEVIGSWQQHKDKIPVISKINSLSNGLDVDGYYRELHAQIKTMFEELSCSSIYGVMLHNYALLDAGGDALYTALLRLKEDGHVSEIGVSVYNGNELRSAVSYDEFTIFQCPMNLFDNPLNGLDLSGKKIFVRSVYLQGLFFLSPEQAENKVFGAGKYIEKVQVMAKEEGLTIAELAFRYVLSHSEIYSLVSGVDNVDQLIENIRKMKMSPLPSRLIKEIETTFKDIPVTIKNPSMWSS